MSTEDDPAPPPPPRVTFCAPRVCPPPAYVAHFAEQPPGNEPAQQHILHITRDDKCVGWGAGAREGGAQRHRWAEGGDGWAQMSLGMGRGCITFTRATSGLMHGMVLHQFDNKGNDADADSAPPEGPAALLRGT